MGVPVSTLEITCTGVSFRAGIGTADLRWGRRCRGRHSSGLFRCHFSRFCCS